MSNRKVQRHTEQIMRVLADAVESVVPGMGFVLLVFPFDTPGVSNYISNAQRTDVVKALRESATRLELRMDHPPGVDPRIYDGN